jgi:hypothetical protein
MDNKKPRLYTPFIHPAFIGGFFLMLVNDLFLRPSTLFPVVTGKISDFAVLVFLPAVGSLFLLYVNYLVSLVRAAVLKTGPAAVTFTLFDLVIPVVFTGAVFTGIKAVPSINALYVDWLNSVNVLKAVIPSLRCVQDPTDLIALPSLIVPCLVLRRWIGEQVA